MTVRQDGGRLRGAAFRDVLDAARANAPWAFERLYTELAPSVAGYLRLRGAAEPEDLTNEVLLGVFRGLPGFEGDEAAFRSWVFTIAHRRLIDERRRRAVRPATTPLEADQHEQVAGNAEDDALALLGDASLRRLLGGLTDDQRDVVLLRVVADLSVEQVAAIMGKRPAAIKMLQRRGLATLRRRIEQEAVTS